MNNKPNYYHRMQYAQKLMQQNARSPNITPEQHEFLKNLSTYRHILHANPEQYFFNTKMTAKIDMFFANMHSAAFAKYLDLPIPDEILKIFDEMQMNKNMQYDDFDKSIENFSINKEITNSLIENYLKEIDKEKQTKYCPTGHLRDENINPVEQTKEKLIKTHDMIKPYQDKIQQHIDDVSNDERNINNMDKNISDLCKEPGFYDIRGKLLAKWDELYDKEDIPDKDGRVIYKEKDFLAEYKDKPYNPHNYDFRALEDYLKQVACHITLPDDAANIPSIKYDHIESMTIPEGIKSIDYGAFYQCFELEKINLPNSITKIDNNAFANCNSLKEITIPENVTSIGDNAFMGCTCLEKVDFSNNKKLQVIGDGTFYNCKRLSNVNGLSDTPTKIIKDLAFCDCENLQNIQLPLQLSELGKSAFKNCSNLEKVIISPNLKKIEERCFSECSNLKSVEFTSNNLEMIDRYAFNNCKKLKEINLPDSLKEIGTSTFNNNYALKLQSFPKNLEKIGNYAFVHCTKLQALSFPENLKTIGIGAFGECKNITALTFSPNMEKIEHSAFCNSEKLNTINLDALKNTDLEYEVFPKEIMNRLEDIKNAPDKDISEEKEQDIDKPQHRKSHGPRL